MGDSKTPYLLIIAAAILWGTTGTAQALGHPSAQPIALGSLRIVIAGTILLFFTIVNGSFNRPRRIELPWVGIGALLVLAYQLSFFVAVRMVGVAVGTVLQIGAAPLVAGFLGVVFLGERISGRWLAATAMGILGIVLVILAPSEGIGQHARQVAETAAPPATYVVGALLAMGAGGAYAGFSLALRHLSEDVGPSTATTVVFSSAAVLSFPIAVAHDLSWLWTFRGAASVLHLGVFATALAYVLFTIGIRRVDFGSAITSTLVEGVTAALLGVLLVGERLTITQAIGISTVLLAVWLNGRTDRSHLE